MKPIYSLLTAALLTLTAAGAARADEGDDVAAAPLSIIVREAADGTREVFRSSAAGEATETNLQAAIAADITDANRLTVTTVADEGDIDTSHEAWFYVAPTWGWNTGVFNYCNPVVYAAPVIYQPYFYNYNYFGFNYYWYRYF